MQNTNQTENTKSNEAKKDDGSVPASSDTQAKTTDPQPTQGGELKGENAATPGGL